MGSALSTASLLYSCQCDVYSGSLGYTLMVRVEAILIPVLLLERELGGRHDEL
jgi:hypothetical protein